MRVAVIIPTYKEAGAIGALLEDIEDVFRDASEHEWHVVVVDANSPDGTGDIVRTKATVYKDIHLIVEGSKRGIAMAYVTGMRYAIDELHADAFVEFDGDGQHDPRDIARLVAQLDRGCDYVIGSRYVEGGTIPQEWAFHRKMLSRFGSLYARLLLELPVHDATSGLKATRVAPLVEALPLSPDELLSRHYAYKLQFLHEAVVAGARVAEIPIVFRLREHDVSKSSLGDIAESLKVTAMLRLRTLAHWRLLRVVCIGAIGLVIQTTVFELLGMHFALVRPDIAVIIGGELAILSNFFLNQRYSFAGRGSDRPLVTRLGRFHLVSFGSIAIQWIFVTGAEALSGTPDVVWAAYIVGVVLGMLTNYSGYYFWVWGIARSLPSGNL